MKWLTSCSDKTLSAMILTCCCRYYGLELKRRTAMWCLVGARASQNVTAQRETTSSFVAQQQSLLPVIITCWEKHRLLFAAATALTIVLKSIDRHRLAGDPLSSDSSRTSNGATSIAIPWRTTSGMCMRWIHSLSREDRWMRIITDHHNVCDLMNCRPCFHVASQGKSLPGTVCPPQ